MLGDTNFIFSCRKYLSRVSEANEWEILSALEDNIRIPARPHNILYIYWFFRRKLMWVTLRTYSETTRTRPLGRRLSNLVFWKQKTQFLIANGPITFIDLKAIWERSGRFNGFKVFNGCIVEPWVLLVHLQKTWESFVFKKTLWLDSVPQSASVWVAVL